MNWIRAQRLLNNGKKIRLESWNISGIYVFKKWGKIRFSWDDSKHVAAEEWRLIRPWMRKWEIVND